MFVDCQLAHKLSQCNGPFQIKKGAVFLAVLCLKAENFEAGHGITIVSWKTMY